MSTAAFDTLRLARNLRDKAKFSPEQAEGLADAMAEAMQGDIATKADIASLRTEISAVRTDMKAEFAVVRAETNADSASLRADMNAESAALRAEIKAEAIAGRTALREAEARLDAKIEKLEFRIDAKIEATKFELVRWLIITQIVVCGFIFTVLKFLPAPSAAGGH